MKEEFKALNQRVYDNPIDENGNQKPNEFLGYYKTIEVIEEDMYSGAEIVVDTKDNVYLLTISEVSGYYNPGMGGVRLNLKKIESLKYIKN